MFTVDKKLESRAAPSRKEWEMLFTFSAELHTEVLLKRSVAGINPQPIVVNPSITDTKVMNRILSGERRGIDERISAIANTIEDIIDRTHYWDAPALTRQLTKVCEEIKKGGYTIGQKALATIIKCGVELAEKEQGSNLPAYGLKMLSNAVSSDIFKAYLGCALLEVLRNTGGFAELTGVSQTEAEILDISHLVTPQRSEKAA